MESKDVEKAIHECLLKIITSSEITKYTSGIHFFEGYENSEPGIYVFYDGICYHWVSVGDRGGIDEKIDSEYIDDIIFKVVWGITSSISTEYARNNKVKGKDWRRTMFPKRLELLKQIDIDYYKKGEEIINNILKNNPYNDKLLW